MFLLCSRKVNGNMYFLVPSVLIGASIVFGFDPEFPVVYMSGARAVDWPSKGVPNSIMLAKPFAPAQLVTAVSQLLNGGVPTT